MNESDHLQTTKESPAMQAAFIRLRIFWSILLVPGAGLVAPTAANACPFCRPVKTTFAEDIGASDVAVLAQLVDRPDRPDAGEGELPPAEIIDSYKATFRISKIYKGDEHVVVGQTVVAIYTGEGEPGVMCLMRGVDPPALQWAPPLVLSERAQQYLEDVLALPEDPGDRLAFFEEYLEDAEEVLANDAYDEFARADYDALKAIKDRMNRERVIRWLQDPETTPASRGLYFTMLSVCGRPEDTSMLEEMITSGDPDRMEALASMISCYLTLTGPDGLPLIEDHFLRGGFFWDPEYVQTYSAITALRFHGESTDIIPRPRLLAALRIMLDRPQLADLVIPDLARWEDWESVDRLVRIFKTADKDTSWVRVPIVNFLRACPLPETEKHLAELSEIDPEAVRRASSLFPYAGPGRAQPAGGDGPASDATTMANAKGESPADSTAASTDGTGSAAARPPGPSDAEQQTAHGDRNLWIVSAPLVAVFMLFGLMWLILRKPREPAASHDV
jgi:hypothetical protein